MTGRRRVLLIDRARIIILLSRTLLHRDRRARALVIRLHSGLHNLLLNHTQR